jgi:uncharacterized membrane protein YdfJ with MMPL/SSD domain
VLRRLADLATRRPRRILLVTVIFTVVAAALGGPVAGLMRAGNDSFDDPGSENVAARAALERATGSSPEPDVYAVVRPGVPVRSPAGRARVREIAGRMAREPAVTRVLSFEQPGGEALISRDGRAANVPAFFRHASVEDKDDAAKRLEKRLHDEPGVKVGGASLANTQASEQVSEDLARAELIAFPILFLLSLWVFRGFVAAALPPLLGGLSILGTMLGLRAAAEFTDLSIFALNLVTGLGLGLAIDYSLFIVSRYREELERVGPGAEALRRTMATAGRTVLFSALTVAAALASLLVFPQRFLYSMGIGGVIVSLVAATLALTALPAGLALLGPRINALSPRRWRRAGEREARAERAGFWYRLSQAVMRRPGRVAVATTVLLIALGLPFLGVRFTSFDPTILPESASARQVFETVERDFPPHRSTPLTIAVDAPRGAGGQVRSYARRLGELPGTAAVVSARPVADQVWQVDVISRGGTLSETSKDLVRAVRAVPAPFPVKVNGESARFVDRQQSLGDHLPLALGLLTLTTFIVLFALTGSVVLPIKALLMNLLTLSAAFGLLVLIFQDGRLEGLLAFTSQGALESTQPLVLFAIAFGLSTDYGVFLLTRIKEAREAGAGERESVAIGLARTGRIVTAAALLFCVAIGAFATSQMIFIKELGLGTALAVMIDATIVRALLVPSLMALLGRWNWWAPRPLRRLHARFGLREGDPQEAGA